MLKQSDFAEFHHLIPLPDRTGTSSNEGQAEANSKQQDNVDQLALIAHSGQPLFLTSCFLRKEDKSSNVNSVDVVFVLAQGQEGIAIAMLPDIISVHGN